MKQAFLLSLALHGILLFLIKSAPIQQAPTVIQVRLAPPLSAPMPAQISTGPDNPPAPVPTVSAQKPDIPQKPPRTPEQKPPQKEKAFPSASRKILALDQPIMESTPPAAARIATSAPEEPGQETASGSDHPPSSTTSQATSPIAANTQGTGERASGLSGHPGADPDALREYKIAISINTRAERRYPKLARERQWEGTVELELDVSSAQPPSVRLVHSSGRTLLDEQALLMLRAAAAKTPLPDSLKGRAFNLKMPIEFKLENSENG